MRDWKINVALAKALGYDPKTQIKVNSREAVFVLRDDAWQHFSYMNWNVVGPIATVLDCFPTQSYNGLWHYSRNEYASKLPQKVIALEAVQLIKEEGLPK